MGDNAAVEDYEGLVEVADQGPEGLYEYFSERGWGDGLPLVAPTHERVEESLSHADGDPDEPVAMLAPRDGVATRRAVAVNAVLAGCRPEYLPVVLTAVRALGHQQVNLRGVNATTHPVAPLSIVHGEVVDALGFNAGLGAFGPGTRANATVGRAVRLVLLHVAGARPGPGDASTQGQPSKYTYCVAENSAESPWEPYHRSVGVEAPSAVTVHCGENPHNFHDMESDRIERILDKAASAMATFGVNNACISGGEWFIGLCPEHAAVADGDGWARADVAAYLFEHARRPASEFRAQFDRLAWADWMRAADDEALLPMTQEPGNIRVFVTGGPGKHSCGIPSWGMTRSVTLPVAG